MGFEEILLQIPISTIFILCLTVALGLFSSTIHRKFVDVEKVKEFRAKMDEIKKQMAEAKRRNDKKALAKLQRKQMVLMRDSSRILSQQSKVMIFTMLPFLVIYWGLASFFGKTIVAFSPIPIPWGTIGPTGTELSFWLWYLLSALALNLPITRLFRLQYT